MLFNISTLYRRIAALLLVSISTEIFLPPAALALTGGPGQPEFSGFEPVGSSNMVNEFTGDFTYNLPVIQVPGPHGSGYALSLSYHSGTSPEEEASWVGYGWSLNPGAINRSTRGLPDDYKGKVDYWNKMPKNWTTTVGAGLGLEAFSKDSKPKGSTGTGGGTGSTPGGSTGTDPQGGKEFKFGVNANVQLRYNNYTGFGYNMGLGLQHKLGISLGMNASDGKRSYSAAINPVAMMAGLAQAGEANSSAAETRGKVRYLVNPNFTLLGGNNGIFTHAESVRPMQIQEMKGKSFSVSVGMQLNPGPAPVGVTTNVMGSYSYQESKSENTSKPSYGFMYTGEKNEGKNENAITDYYVEKESPFQKRDVNLGVPFNNADNFVVSGEGLVGGFRMYHKQTGAFSPNKVKNETELFVAGGEINAGFTFGAGIDNIKIGKQELTVSGWDKAAQKFSTPGQAGEDEPVFFRFNNDIGGTWQYGVDTSYLETSLKKQGLGYVPRDVRAQLQSPTGRAARSTYIAYHTNKEIIADNRLTSHQAYTKRKDIESITSRVVAEDGIGEFAITNESGQRYVYGLPLYNRNESSLLYGVRGVDVDNNYLVYDSREDMKIGQEMRGAPYASTFLLTEVTTPDYVDRTLNGPSADDFGGYTVFGYDKVYGYKAGSTDQNNWYKWRTPYTGMLYQRNSPSDPLDDMGSVTEGEKEIAYLQYVKTKTHVAVFRTKKRDDGYEASKKDVRSERGGTGDNTLRYLDRIDLYLLSDLESASDELTFDANGSPKIKAGRQPVKTVRFAYAFNAWKDVPNSKDKAGNRTGKMTLTKVWFEYNGISRSKISPYEFKYTYPDYGTYPAAYSALMAKGYQNLKETPGYSPFALDAWGGYQDQAAGAGRYARLQTWMDQTPDAADFDPAAWQLKRIQLPSGGEIHVQYEQDDYTHVQDKPAHVMARLKGASDGKASKFYIDLTDLGVSAAEAKKLLEAYYINNPKGPKKIYFKFLYALMGNSKPELSKYNADYISGYADVESVGTDSNGLFIQLKDKGHALPSQVCEDFVRTQRAGRFKMDKNGKVSLNEVPDKGDIVAKVKGLMDYRQILSNLGSLCLQLDPELSYFRIPFPGNKKGGGLRVKRLLTYDKGFDGQPVLYGNEYDYRIFDEGLNKWRSSGVATNEPASIREENVLVEYIARKKQKWISKIISGEDKQQAEGPLGESIMPAPAVGYARVLVKNIHSGITHTGFTVKEYYTAKDFPVKVKTSPLDIKTRYVPPQLLSISESKVWAAQGFYFMLNNMHGQVKRVATYAGIYSEQQGLTKEALSSETVYEYVKPGEQIRVQKEFDGKIAWAYPGRETDVTIAHKAVTEQYTDANVESDVSVVTFIFPPVFFTYFPSVTKSDMGLYTYATSKVVRYPAILKKVSSTQQGMTQTTEHLVFDAASGKPVLTKTEDEVKGNYVSREAMASWFYPGMGAKWMTENKTVSLTGKNMVLTSEGGKWFIQLKGTPLESCELFKEFTPGDLVLLNNKYPAHIDVPDCMRLRIPVYPAANMLDKDFANNGLTIQTFKILRSGRSNQLGAKAGATVQHYNMLPASLLDSTQRLGEVKPNSFESDLEKNLSTTTYGEFWLNGEYEPMNVPMFANRLSNACTGNGARTFVRQMRFRKQKEEDGKVMLQLLSFEVSCDGKKTWTLVE